MTRRLAQAALSFGAAIPIITVLWLIAEYGHNIPFMEEWITTGDVAIRTASGTLRVEDLFSPWKDHRMLLLNLIAVINTALFGWNLTLQQFGTLALAGINFFLLLQLWRLSGLPHRAAYAVPLSLLVFSLHQAETWLWAFQIAWQILNLSFLFALLTILKPNSGRLQSILSGVLCLLSMLTLSNTIIIFPLLIGTLILRGRVRRWEWAVWLSCALIAGAIYVSATGLHSAVRPDLVTGVMQFLIYLSRSLFLPREPFSGAVSLIGLFGLLTFFVLTVWLLVRGQLRTAVLWLIMAVYGMATGIGGVLNRWELNLGYAADSRYVTASIFFWIGLLGCLALCSSLFIRWRGLFFGLAGVISLALLFTLGEGLTEPHNLTRITRITEHDIICAVNLPELTDISCMRGLSVFQIDRELDTDNPAILEAYRSRVRAYRTHGLALFGDDSSSAALTPSPKLTGGS